ncbi:ABC transporter ATP-binding protein [Salsipaludibacter albus]|uniref:ABC transporter ATP-binding protein n=1 Tax=Salsipaludibacter albus TaxID=2849650 RepID=UPI001EE49E8B|nr:ABC transporter ATP-binding protein [Salsipaludibacter albus]MBY5161598.1 ABC transporter ATP-binding protein [Salsipaludibacter albus]
MTSTLAPRALPALTGQDLCLAYDDLAVVEAVDIAIVPGRVTALLGPNGSGKSTVLRALARLHHRQAGSIALADVGDVDLLSARDFARHVTLLSQSRPTPGGVRVRDVVGYGRHPHRSGWRGGDPDGSAAVARAMDLTGTTAMADRGVDELSGGERQRVWFAMCLAQDTATLLLDEPTNHLDLRYQVEVLDLVRDLADDHGVAVGVVLHDLDQAAAVADDVVLLADGGVHAAGPPGDVLTGPVLEAVYGIPIEVHHDPAGRLHLRPVGRHDRATVGPG